MSTNAPARPQSRRSLLTAAAAGTLAGGATFAVQVAARAPAGLDPVFALIAAEREAEAAFLAAIDAARAAEEAFGETGLDRQPRVQVGTFATCVARDGGTLPPAAWKSEPAYAHSREEIEAAYRRRSNPDMTVATGARTVTMRSETTGDLAAALARFDADAAEIEAARERCGIEAAERREDEADVAQRAALLAVCRATPTTTAGLLGMIRLFEEREADVLPYPADEFLAGLFAAVRSIVREA